MNYEPANGERWMAKRRCADYNAEEFFRVEPTGIKRKGHVKQAFAKDICATCPVRTECLTFALEHREEWGVWGGLDEDERKALLRNGAA